jgi:hypothetical protein
MNNHQCLAFQGFLLIFILFSLGCAKQHSVQVNDDSLSFYYSDEKAKEVFFVSSADHFHYHPAIKGANNIWHVTVPLNKEFTYFYIVDGKISIPDCPHSVLDDFGSRNCLYIHLRHESTFTIWNLLFNGTKKTTK